MKDVRRPISMVVLTSYSKIYALADRGAWSRPNYGLGHTSDGSLRDSLLWKKHTHARA